MARTAQEVLEFDKLRELLRLRTTCAPGRRAADALEPGTNRVALESAFALIREARECLRAGHELGFGALADPQGWLDRIEGPGAVLEPGGLLDSASLLETASWALARAPTRKAGSIGSKARARCWNRGNCSIRRPCWKPRVGFGSNFARTRRNSFGWPGARL